MTGQNAFRELQEPCITKPVASRERLILFTRYPAPGRAKTRLIPALGAEGAAKLHRRLTMRALRCAEALQNKRGTQIEVQFDGGTETEMQHWLGDRFTYQAQTTGDLGQRMSHAFEKAFAEGCQYAVAIGSDCPELSSDIIGRAFERLAANPVVIGPASDGGYYLLGLRQHLAALFEGPTWGSDKVLSETLGILRRLGLGASTLEPLADMDRPEDLEHWNRLYQGEESGARRVSVIIPALNEAENIGATIASVRKSKPFEVIVVDGGSRDDTAERARRAGATVIHSCCGRARQFNAGASLATGNVLLFLHADTLLPDGYDEQVLGALANPGTVAGAFRFKLTGEFAGRGFVEWTTHLRSHYGQRPYGDQGLFMKRALFEEIGGYSDLPLFEDYEIVRRLRRCGRVITLPQPALTSGRRWEQLGVIRTTLLNKWMILGYRLGWPVEKLAVSYRSALRRKD